MVEPVRHHHRLSATATATAAATAAPPHHHHHRSAASWERGSNEAVVGRFVHEQCEDRTYRIKQQKQVFVQYLVASRPGGTLDEAVMQLGDKKRDDAATLLGGTGQPRGERSIASLFKALGGRAASRPPTAGAAGGAPSGTAETGAGAPGSNA